MDNDQNFDDTTTEEDSEDENVPCYPDMFPQECNKCIHLVLMVMVLDLTLISIIYVTRLTEDAGYVMIIAKRVPIMDIINGLKKNIIPHQ